MLVYGILKKKTTQIFFLVQRMLSLFLGMLNLSQMENRPMILIGG